MNILELFEEEDEIGIKDPKAAQALKLARSKYGWAENDLEAFLAMMQDEQEKQDGEIDSQFHVNTDQEKEIGGNDTDIASLEQRISALEKGRPAESVDEAGTGSQSFSAAVNKSERGRQQAIKKAKRWMKKSGKSAAEAQKEFDLNPKDLNEGPADNFTADDLQSLSGIRDLATLKARAMELIGNPNSTRPMKPEKVAWFQRAVDAKKNPAAIIKLMWDLLLSGEGHAVKGSRYSTDKSSYRKKFNEAGEEDPQQKTIDRLKASGGRMYSDRFIKDGVEGRLGTNGSGSNEVYFLIPPDGKFIRAKSTDEIEAMGWIYQEPVKKDPINLKFLARMIAEKASEAFPDMDPFDLLMPYVNKMERLGLDPMEQMDKATKQYLGSKDYHGYLADFYDDASPGEPNPWR